MPLRAESPTRQFDDSDSMPRREYLAKLGASSPAVLPSLLMCDFGNLEREIRQLEAAGVSALHLDVMDGHFVPNLTYGLLMVETFRRLTDLPLDVHLMIDNPEEYLARYIDAGADNLTIHVEAVDDAAVVLQEICDLGAGAGLALNPATPINAISDALPLCDLVLVMSVMPGFGGQKFDSVALEKLKELRPQIGRDTLLEVDGGINEETIGDCAAAGAQLLVAGSAIFNSDNYQVSIDSLQRLAEAAC